MDRIILLTDYRNSFYSRMGSQEDGFEQSKLKEYFLKEGFSLDILQFCDINFEDSEWYGTPVLYTSLEDPELYYKNFIEDVILGLEMAGAWIIPSFYFLRAHHNKVFLEILRQNSKLTTIKNLHGHFYGVPSECEERATNFTFPVVVKPAAGAMSTGVTLVKTVSELRKTIYKISKTDRPLREEFRNIIRPYARKIKKLLNPGIKFGTIVSYREKFVTQQFIEGLQNDFKILVYNDKYYVLKRENRKNDFRASGSGLLSYPQTLPDGMLDYVKEIFEYFDVPYLSLDIAYNGKVFFLIEFQFLMFGTYTLEKSLFYFQLINNQWIKVDGESKIEYEFVRSVSEYIRRKKETKE
jgi:hypothetical protein